MLGIAEPADKRDSAMTISATSDVGIISAAGSSAQAAMSVATSPGDTAVAVTPLSASSSVKVSHSEMRPALLAAYAARFASE